MTSPFHPLPGSDLPIHRLDGPQYTSYYAPGCLCVVDASEAERFEGTLALQNQDPPTGVTAATPPREAAGQVRSSRPVRDWGGELVRCATQAVQETQRQHTEPFEPECLTLYLNNECNLRCTYCYAEPSPGPSRRLEREAIAAAADLVAGTCRQRDRTFYAVFHGGGEPTLCPEELEAALALVEAAARSHDVELYRYIATHGVLSEEMAAWLALHFDLVGLSCDGPPAVHDRQRPRGDGRGTSALVARTARILSQEGAAFHVRATITESSLHRQAEVAEYICRELTPQEIHFEPVYRGGRTRTNGGLAVDQAASYVAHFLAAQRVARGYGIPLHGAGSQPWALHGPPCHVFRQVVNLVPGALVTACFKFGRAEEVRKRGAAIGALHPITGRLEIDHRQVQALRRRLGATPAACQGCISRYHCVRDCPDRCPLDGMDPELPMEPGFRCQVQKTMIQATLEGAAGRLWAAARARGEKGPHGTRDIGTGTA